HSQPPPARSAVERAASARPVRDLRGGEPAHGAGCLPVRSAVYAGSHGSWKLHHAGAQRPDQFRGVCHAARHLAAARRSGLVPAAPAALPATGSADLLVDDHRAAADGWAEPPQLLLLHPGTAAAGTWHGGADRARRAVPDGDGVWRAAGRVFQLELVAGGTALALAGKPGGVDWDHAGRVHGSGTLVPVFFRVHGLRSDERA